MRFTDKMMVLGAKASGPSFPGSTPLDKNDRAAFLAQECAIALSMAGSIKKDIEIKTGVKSIGDWEKLSAEEKSIFVIVLAKIIFSKAAGEDFLNISFCNLGQSSSAYLDYSAFNSNLTLDGRVPQLYLGTIINLLSHEACHCRQHKFMGRNLSYDRQFEPAIATIHKELCNYVAPEDNFREYLTQLTEEHANDFAVTIAKEIRDSFYHEDLRRTALITPGGKTRPLLNPLTL